MECLVGLDHVRRFRHQADGQGGGGQIRGGKEHHARVSRDQLMPVGSDRNVQGAAAPPPLGVGREADRVAATGAAAPILSVNNINVVYDPVILVLTGASLSVPSGTIHSHPGPSHPPTPISPPHTS